MRRPSISVSVCLPSSPRSAMVLRPPTWRGEKIEKYKASGEIGEGDGEKAGVAYRMKDGSMVYVPEGGAVDQATAPAPLKNVGAAPGGMGGR